MIQLRSDIFSFIILLGVIQGIYLSLFFIFRRTEVRKASLFLGLILFFTAILNFDFWSGYTFTTLRYPHLLDISVPFSLTMGPLTYHYTRYYLHGKNGKLLGWHYLPAVICLIYSMFFFLQSADFKYNTIVRSRALDLPMRTVDLRFPPDPWNIRQYIGSLLIIQLVAYIGLSIKSYVSFIKDKSIAIRNTSLQGQLWLRSTLISACVVIGVAVFVQLFYPGGRAEFVLAVFLTLFTYFISFYMIQHSGFFKQAILPDKYKKSSLKKDNKNELISRIDEYMNTHKEYLGNLFSLKTFSRAIGISPDHLSQVLNQYYGKTFFEFMALYRIQEARKILSDPQKAGMKIDEVALSVGYNSKSAFTKAFKSSTGKTPGDFRKTILKD